MHHILPNFAAGFLPNYFKKLGILLIVFTFVPLIFIKLARVDISQFDRNWFRIFTFNFLILGLLFVAWAKDKIEDELSVIIRFKSMAWTFILAVLYVLVKPLMDIVFEKNISDLPGQILVISMLVVYLLLYTIQMRRR